MEKVSFFFVVLSVIKVKTKISLVYYLVYINHLPKMKYIAWGNIRQRNIIRGTVRQGNVRSGIFPFRKLSFGELSVREMFSGNSQFGKYWSGECGSGNCPRTVMPVYRSLE